MVFAKAVSNRIVPPCAEWYGMDIRQPYLTTVVQSTAFLPVWSHCTNSRWNRCQDSKLENWRRPPGRLHTTCIQQNLKSNNVSLNAAIDMAQNRPLWKMTATIGTTDS